MDRVTDAFDGVASRRRFLQAAAAGGGLAGLSQLAGVRAQSQQPTTIRLDGEVDGWVGRSPQSIQGTTNPTIELDAGQDYRIMWKNVDGKPHNVVLLDQGGETLKRTPVISEQGATQTLAFTATPRMASYLCEVHPTSMRGELDLGEDAATTTETTVSPEDRYFQQGESVRLETVVSGGPDSPLDFAVPPGTQDQRYIVDRSGQVYLHTSNGLQAEPFIDVSDEMAEISGEMGLVGMAFHPNYGQNRKFYLRYSAPPREGTPDDYNHTSVLAEFTANADGTAGNPDSERTVLQIPHPQPIHNAGQIAFGPDDGYLYTGIGDGGGGSDDNLGHVEDWYEPLDGGNGQDVTENLLGGILRIDVDSQDGEKAYGIPEDNPLVGRDGLDEYYAWGLRNPWRMGFSNGQLFAGDVGQNSYEEINLVEKGGNYGWNIREGSHCFQPRAKEATEVSDDGDCPTKLPDDVRGGEPLVDPIIEYPHSHNGRGVGASVIGGYVYTNDTVPAMTGKYVFGDFRKNIGIDNPSGSLFAATNENGEWSTEELTISNGDDGRVGDFVLAIGRDNAGELYVLATSDHDPGEGTGVVYRIAESRSSQTTTGTTTGTATPTGNTTSTTTGATTTNATNATTAGNTTGTNAAGNATTGATGTTNGTPAGTPAGSTTGNATTSGGGGDGRSTSSGGTTGSGGSSSGNGSSGGSGPGFGALAAVAGLALGAVRLLRRGGDED